MGKLRRKLPSESRTFRVCTALYSGNHVVKVLSGVTRHERPLPQPSGLCWSPSDSPLSGEMRQACPSLPHRP
ncbi:Golgin Subfamily A Member 6-Like Protein 22 [Manis pentadactyla]|nr:Golgin Subfamily A Member 6-Like Protein 22 [Manis pentadactyla]